MYIVSTIIIFMSVISNGKLVLKLFILILTFETSVQTNGVFCLISVNNLGRIFNNVSLLYVCCITKNGKIEHINKKGFSFNEKIQNNKH